MLKKPRFEVRYLYNDLYTFGLLNTLKRREEVYGNRASHYKAFETLVTTGTIIFRNIKLTIKL